MARFDILILAGDGIGPEVMHEAERVIAWFGARIGHEFALQRGLVGGAAIDAEGTPLSATTLAAAKAADIVMLGAVGGPKWDGVPYAQRPEAGLLALRKELDLFANLRPAICYPALADASSLKHEHVQGLDLLIVRELTGGVYFGEPKELVTLESGERRAIDTQIYAEHEIARIAQVAFALAAQRRGRLASAEKSNVMKTGVLWRAVVSELAGQHPGVETSHILADNCAMQLVRNPKQFDVIVTDNLFGDVLSDVAAMLTGSLGMLPSASLGPPRAGRGAAAMYEPVHGSAPDIAGRGIANPIATIASFGMALRYSLGLPEAANTLDLAIADALAAGHRTADIAAPGEQAISTAAMGDAIISALEAHAA